MTVRCIRAGLVPLLLALASCGGGGPRVQSVPAPAKSVSGTTESAFALLMAGDEGGARKQAKAILKRSPNDAPAQLLLDSLQRDPVELLGPESFAYTVRPRDTMVTVADRFLGNKYKAYQLLRYNKLRAPVTLVTGQTLRIPGSAPRIDVPKRVEPAPTRATPAPSQSTAAKPKPAPAAATPAAANPVAARQARAAGLAALNQGAVTRAIGLLRRSVALDPGNPAAARDLARAERIAATVRAKR